MRQRVMIAIGLACDPELLIADEPTTALDVTIQAQIVDLVKELRQKLGMSVVWITHDLALIAGLVDRIAVLYAGTVVEDAPVDELFARPSHPYTRGPSRLDPQALRRAHGPPPLDRRHAARARPPPEGLPLRAALPAGRARSATSACRRSEPVGRRPRATASPASSPSARCRRPRDGLPNR